MNLIKKISNFTGKKAIDFYNTLLDRCNDRVWCKDNNIDYVNPDINTIKEIVYREIFQDKSPYNEPSQMYTRLSPQDI